MPRPDECHHPANGLLPWYAKGTLQGAELEWVKDHVESCDSCSYEFESLTAPAVNEPEPPRTPAPANPSRRSLLLVGALVVTVAAGICGVWMSTDGARAARFASATYLDLGVGPTRSTDPPSSVSRPDEGDSLVISFFPPLSVGATYSFDLEGPRGNTLIKRRPITDLDEVGRSTYAFPASLFPATGDYAIVVRVTSPDGETRLYPFPFVLNPPQRQAPASTNPPQ